MHKPRLGVTGATGMIGRVLMPILRQEGYETVVFSRRQGESGQRLIIGEINDEKKVAELVAGVDIVLHLAAVLNLGEGDEAYFRRVNVEGTRLVLKWCKKLGRKLILVSSIAVFADTGTGEEKNEGWKLVDKSKNRYIMTKKEQLILVRSYSGVEKMVVFPSVVINPRDYEKRGKMSGWQGWLWEKLGGGVPGGLMATIGSRARVMNIVAVDDLCQGLVALLRKGKWGEEYIMGGENISAGEYLHRLRDKYQCRTAIFRVPNAAAALLGGEVAENIPVNQNLSSKKAQRELGYKIRWRL